jgi:hypothetical protein
MWLISPQPLAELASCGRDHAPTHRGLVPTWIRCCYTYSGPMRPGATPDAAVAAAASHTLLTLLTPLPDSPQKQAAIDLIAGAFLTTLGAPPYAPAIQDGITVGEAPRVRRD